MAHNPWNIAPGLNNVGSYQVSGQPWATSSIRAHVSPQRVQFPKVTQWVQIINNDTTASCVVSFSHLGGGSAVYSGSHAGSTGYHMGYNYFTVAAALDAAGTDVHSRTAVLDWKVSELWVRTSSDVTIIAGLTNIKPESCGGETGPSWSGSSGVG